MKTDDLMAEFERKWLYNDPYSTQYQTSLSAYKEQKLSCVLDSQRSCSINGQGDQPETQMHCPAVIRMRIAFKRVASSEADGYWFAKQDNPDQKCQRGQGSCGDALPPVTGVSTQLLQSLLPFGVPDRGTGWGTLFREECTDHCQKCGL